MMEQISVKMKSLMRAEEEQLLQKLKTEFYIFVVMEKRVGRPSIHSTNRGKLSPNCNYSKVRTCPETQVSYQTIHPQMKVTLQDLKC